MTFQEIPASLVALVLVIFGELGTLAWSYLRHGRRCTETRAHPYLQGNFAPIHKTLPLTRCAYTGELPHELFGGQYVRNGGNPVSNEDLGRDAHWFDGDGMLSGVAFLETPDGDVQPHFVNRYILTDIYLSAVTTPWLPRKIPILPSITTLINPLSSLVAIVGSIFRTISLVVLSHLPGSLQAIKKISVANTGILYHDGRALATCESGPPMRVALPSLETIGWFTGERADGEPGEPAPDATSFGGSGPFAFLREWTTAHPRSDPRTGELLLFHSTFVPPYVRYSIVPEERSGDRPGRHMNLGVPGVTSPKMMHDFGVSREHTIILDLPLSLAPQNLALGKPVVAYDPTSPSRFGVFPRYKPDQVRWFETDPCCIFHTANTWDTDDAVHLLACRLTSPSLVFSAGGLPIPASENDQCRLYYYQFPRDSSTQISREWALCALPFEFPTIPNSVSMSSARYVYGCSSASNFSAALGRAVKIDTLVRIDVQQLIARGIAIGTMPVTGCVDTRSVAEIATSTDPEDPIRVFQLPEGWYAQEPRFVARDGGREEDGWLLTYVFNEDQLQADGEAGPNAISELWIIDATRMSEGMDAVVGRVKLPQRVPYGLHGSWFSKSEIENQRPWETLRSLPVPSPKDKKTSYAGAWDLVRNAFLEFLG